MAAAALLAGCGPSGFPDRPDGETIISDWIEVFGCTAQPAAVRAGETARLSWWTYGTRVRITEGECANRRSDPTGASFPEPCPEERVLFEAQPAVGSVTVAPTATTTYWCFPDPLVGFPLGRRAVVLVTP